MTLAIEILVRWQAIANKARRFEAQKHFMILEDHLRGRAVTDRYLAEAKAHLEQCRESKDKDYIKAALYEHKST